MCQKGLLKMTFYDEILQQPEALRNFSSEVVFSEEASKIKGLNIENRRLIFTGMGSSLYAGYIASDALFKKNILSQSSNVEVLMESPEVVKSKDSLFVIVSQSGSSPEVIELVNAIPDKKRIIAVTNYPKSPLFCSGGYTLSLSAGVEYCTSSKSFTNTIAAMRLLVELLSKSDDSVLERLKCRFEDAAEVIESIISDDKRIDAIVNFFSNLAGIACVGSGSSYTSASHLELVMEEACKVYATRYSVKQFIHGPIELINPFMGTILLDFDPHYHTACERVAMSMEAYGGKTLWITNRADAHSSSNTVVYRIPFEDYELSPLVEIIPLELAVYRYIKAQGGEAGQIHRVVKRMSL